MAHDIQWETICGNHSPFWDNDLSWNTTLPRFTDCFQNTVLTFIPCTFLWIFLPLKIFSLRRSRTRLLPWTILNIMKLVLSSFLSLLFIIKLIFVLREDIISLLHLVNCIFQVSTFILSFVIINLDRKYGIQSSCYMFCHWLLLTIAGIFTSVHYSSEFTTISSTYETASFIIFSIYYPLVISQLILSGLQDALPIYSTRTELIADKKENPYESASFLSVLTLSWFDRLLWNGFRKELKAADVWQAITQVRTETSVPNIIKHVSQDSSENKRVSLVRIIWKTHWKKIVTTVLMFLMANVCIFTNPIILKEFYRMIASDEPVWHGYIAIALIFVFNFGDSLFTWNGFYHNQIIGCSVKSALTSLIYRKSLKMSSSFKQTTTTGQLINLISVDVQRVVLSIDDGLYALIFPIQISVGIYMLYNLVGVAALPGFGVTIVVILFTIFLSDKREILETKQVKLKDDRIKNLSEAISGVKVLKFFAWEKPFMERIGRIRRQETWTIRNCLIIEGITNLLWGIGPMMMNMLIFATYILMDSNNVLDVEKIFITITIVKILQIPMMRLPMVMAGFVQARVSVNRLNDYMNGKDLDEKALIRANGESGEAVVVTNGSFSWSSMDIGNQSKMYLERINFQVARGSLVAVVGPVGCGKSSLLSALLGEMDKLSGSVTINGRIAYVGQQAWIQNATLKDNILFGKSYDKRSYDRVIKCCDLEPDIAIMPGGDQAEIGEKGINLSGGQKQRISLARAVYDDADVYLLDDPLSAVDTHVGSHLFNNVFGPQGILKQKTKILVTHSLTYLPLVDNIVVMSDGKISEMGTYRELMDENNGFAQYLRTYRTDESHSAPKFDRSESVKSDTNISVYGEEELDDGQLIASEHMERGKVKSSIYLLYLKYVGYPLIAVALLLAFVSFAFEGATEIWLSHWSMDGQMPMDNQSSTTTRENTFWRLGGYGLLASGYSFFAGIFSIAVVFGAMRACITLHRKLLYSVLRCPMSFFDTTPSGRIMNRFSKDIEMVDGSLPMSFQNLLWSCMFILESLVVIFISLPIFIAVIIPTFVVYYLTQKFYVRTLDQLRRLESISRSPMYSRFSETLAGSSTLRAFQKEKEFIRLFDDLIDDNMKYVFHVKSVFQWVALRLDFVGNIFITLTALFGLLYRDSLGAGTVALIVNSAVSICFTFQWLVENAGSLESNIVSVERLNEYISLPSEASWEGNENEPDPSWPSRGEIKFNNYSTKYREELTPVLKNINFKINSGEKIGVIGRTGAGKSSVALALFRMMEASEGNVTIDDVDVSQIGLHDLRSRLTVIPQDPVLFSGPLRINLDPFSRYNDEQLWRALDLAHLKKFVSQSSSGLDQEISEGGSNLSVGQKQLVCLARALLKKTKILVLDEATAAVDSQTDSLIQSTIRSEFNDCTILTIAHRLNTIMDSSRLLVLNDGKVQAFDRPSKLIETIKSSLDDIEN